MKKTSFNSIKAFKEFVYEPGEGHYFCFCPVHDNLMLRKQDVSDEFQNHGEKCNYPKCSLDATSFFFPNLATVLKRNK